MIWKGQAQANVFGLACLREFKTWRRDWIADNVIIDDRSQIQPRSQDENSIMPK